MLLYNIKPLSLPFSDCPTLFGLQPFPLHTLVLELVQVHVFAGFGVKPHGYFPLRLPPLQLFLLAGSPRHLLL